MKSNCSLSNRVEPQENRRLYTVGMGIIAQYMFTLPVNLNYLHVGFAQSAFKAQLAFSRLPWYVLGSLSIMATSLSGENPWDLSLGDPAVSLGYALSS